MRVTAPRPRRLAVSVLFIILSAIISMMLLASLLVLPPCAWLVRSRCYRGYQSDYSFDAGSGLNPAWMSTVPDSVNLSSLSIPGTHDTMTYDLHEEIFQCQNQNLSTQLRAGMRYLDIRARLVNDTLGIYHASRDTGYTFTDVLVDVFAFLEENSSEAIIMRVKQEGQRIGTGTLSFEDVFNRYRLDDPSTSAGFQKHLYLPASFAQLPTIGELRGKILILQEFPSDAGPYGILWGATQIKLEDLWIIPSVDHLWMKWDAISNALTLAASAPDDNSVLYLSHLSAAVGVLPIEAAAGPLNRTIVGMNDRTGRWLDAGKPEDRTGVVIIDFPGQPLIDAVLARNEGVLGMREL